MKSKANLLIGPPGSGKTAVLNELKSRGYDCFPEVSREITRKYRANGNEQIFLDDPLKFSEELLKGRIDQFIQAKETGANTFIDRGIPDVSTYMDFKNTTYPNYFHLAHIEYRYDHIFFFPYWDDIYVSDSERYEDKKTAQKLGKLLRINYKKAGYGLTTVPLKTVEERADFIEDKLNLNA